MTTKSMRYDHPAYIARITAGGELGQSASFSYAAFTTMLVKSIEIAGVIAQGTANTYVVYSISQSGTSTTTIGTYTVTAGNLAQSTNITPTTTLSQGDAIRIVSGAADSVGKVGIGLELAVVPGSTVTS